MTVREVIAELERCDGNLATVLTVQGDFANVTAVERRDWYGQPVVLIEAIIPTASVSLKGGPNR